MGIVACYASDVEGAGWDAAPTLCLGVGMAAAAATLAAALHSRSASSGRPELVLLFGVAGAFPPRHRHGVTDAIALGVGETCVVSDDTFADLGVETPDGFASLRTMGLSTAQGPFECDPVATAAVAERLGIPVVRAATVACGSGTEARSQAICSRTGASIETMEGAAVALVCAKAGVPLVHLRTVSNFTGDRSEGGWDLASACANVRAAARTAVLALS